MESLLRIIRRNRYTQLNPRSCINNRRRCRDIWNDALLFKIEFQVNTIVDDIVNIRLYVNGFLSAGTVSIRLVKPAVCLQVVPYRKIKAYVKICVLRIGFNKRNLKWQLYAFFAVRAAKSKGAAVYFTQLVII